MAEFDPFFELVMRHEVIAYGTSHEIDYSNVPGDHGGETKFGISKAAFPDVDIKSLTKDQARQIYLDHFWTPYRLAEIGSQHIANFIGDLLVNMGPYHDFQIVQHALDALGNDVEADGKVGPKTLAAINATDPVQLKAQIVKSADQFYVNLHQPEFLKGWLNRVKDDEANA
jgi:lysozyme family protein